jgi:hypothetical protein
MQAVTLQSVTKISPGHIAAMREFMKGVPNWRKQLNVRTACPVLVFQFETRAGIFLECTRKLRQEIKGPEPMAAPHLRANPGSGRSGGRRESTLPDHRSEQRQIIPFSAPS